MNELQAITEVRGEAKPWLSSPNGTQYAKPGQEELTPAEVEELLAQLAVEAQKRKRKKRIKFIIVGVYLSFVLISVAARLYSHSRGGPSFPFINMFWMLGGLGAASQLQKEGVRKLARNLDIRGVGHFVDALAFGDKDIARSAADSLIVLLPRLQASDADLINDEQRAILYKQIRGDNTELVLAILKSLEQIGDEKVMPFVEERASGSNRKGRSQSIREAALACLPALNARVEMQRASHTLLRAAESDREDSEVLLRPAESAHTPEGTLLKPAGPPGQETVDVDESHNTSH
jgi:hypothetical protein